MVRAAENNRIIAAELLLRCGTKVNAKDHYVKNYLNCDIYTMSPFKTIMKLVRDIKGYGMTILEWSNYMW